MMEDVSKRSELTIQQRIQVSIMLTLSWLRSGYQTEHSLQRQLTVSSRQQVLKNRK